MHNLAIVYRVVSYHTFSALSCRHVKYFWPTDDEGCEDATELLLIQNVIANENELLKKETKSNHTTAVQHVAVLNCGHPSSSGSTANPDKNSAVSDFFCCTVIAWYKYARYENVLNYYHTASN